MRRTPSSPIVRLRITKVLPQFRRVISWRSCRSFLRRSHCTRQAHLRVEQRISSSRVNMQHLRITSCRDGLYGQGLPLSPFKWGFWPHQGEWRFNLVAWLPRNTSMPREEDPS